MTLRLAFDTIFGLSSNPVLFFSLSRSLSPFSFFCTRVCCPLARSVSFVLVLCLFKSFIHSPNFSLFLSRFTIKLLHWFHTPVFYEHRVHVRVY